MKARRHMYAGWGMIGLAEVSFLGGAFVSLLFALPPLVSVRACVGEMSLLFEPWLGWVSCTRRVVCALPSIACPVRAGDEVGSNKAPS